MGASQYADHCQDGTQEFVARKRINPDPRNGPTTLKIAFLQLTATTSFGGIETKVWSLGNEFAREGHDVTIIGGQARLSRPYGDSIKTATFPYTPRERFPELGRSFSFPKMAERFSLALGAQAREAVRRGHFDWVILHKPFDFFWPWLPGIPKSTRFAFMSGGTDFMPLDRILVRKVKRLFACSYFNARQISDHFHRQVTVVYNGVDTDKFAPSPQRETWRLNYECAARDVLFGFAGRLVGLKGLNFVIRALASEPLINLPVRLLLAGDGPVRDELEQLSQSLGVASRVSFLGPLEHASVACFYSACDVGVFPSISDEAFGISIAEAMSCGIPVIGSYIGGIPEVIGNDGSCGFLVPPNDPLALALRVREFALSPRLRLDSGRRARERILENFTWRRAAQSLLDGLSEIDGAPR